MPQRAKPSLVGNMFFNIVINTILIPQSGRNWVTNLRKKLKTELKNEIRPAGETDDIINV